ncbi:MAG: hypothetical protein NVSMB51_00270 [Solirubrobacteraceae bacterium]
MPELSFHERMHGWISFSEASYNQALVHGHQSANTLSFSLTAEIDDIDRFLCEPGHRARLSGDVDCPQLGGTLHAERGELDLLTGAGELRARQMVYRLWLRDRAGRPLTLSGIKDVRDDPNLDVWQDTSRLRVRLLSGHHDVDPGSSALTIATGILFISRAGSLAMLGSFRGSARSRAKFIGFFARELAHAYRGPAEDINADPWHGDVRWHGEQPGSWHEPLCAPGLRRRILGYRADDGRHGTLHNLRGAQEPTAGPVLLLHGCSMRANMFYGSPGRATLAHALVNAGYDVWASNWRGSIDLPPSPWTLDEVAVNDHPAAVARIIAETGSPTLKAIVHCQGSTSFMMAAVAGLLPQVTDVVSHAVSLHISLTRRSQLKLRALTPPLGLRLKGIDPQWAALAPSAAAHAMTRWATLVRRGCDSDVCRVANYAYGAGPEVLWRHANLTPEIHDWGAREFGFCPISFFAQMARCARAGHLVAAAPREQLPADLIDGNPQTDARFSFIAGEQNRCFLPASQVRSHDYFDALAPGRHTLDLVPGYSHLDMFLGRAAQRTVYPLILERLSSRPHVLQGSGRQSR